jgi:putative Holliday junction resolvase
LVVVGLPFELDGSEGRSARLARQVGDALGTATGLPIFYQDERYSTVVAEERLRAAGYNGYQRKSIIDQAAAAVILGDYFDQSG